VANVTRIELEGVERLARRLEQLGRKGALIQNKALREGGKIVADAMRNNVNRSKKMQTHIQDDIKISRVKGDRISARHVEVGPGKETAWRAKFLEFGTKKMPAYPFVEPSLVEKREEVIETIRENFKEGLGL